MKGMIIKDFRLLKSQWATLLFITGIAIGISLSGGGTTFVIGFIPFGLSMFTLSTIAYDEFENGNAFLFTLPIDRRLYVKEKYVFSLILGMGSLLIATIVALGLEMAKGGSTQIVFATAAVIFALVLIFQSIIIPFQLKFGSEKSRIAMVASFGLIVLIGMLLSKIIGFFGIDTSGFYTKIESLSLGAILLILIGLAVLVALVSLKISVRIMEKKEF